MRIKCVRSVITSDGMQEIVFEFDTDTLELHFDPKDKNLLISLFNGDAVDIPETGNYTFL